MQNNTKFSDISSLICISVVKVNWLRLLRWGIFMNHFMLTLLFSWTNVLISLWWWRRHRYLIDFVLLFILCNCRCSQTPAGLTMKKMTSDLWETTIATCMLPTDQLVARWPSTFMICTAYLTYWCKQWYTAVLKLKGRDHHRDWGGLILYNIQISGYFIQFYLYPVLNICLHPWR